MNIRLTSPIRSLSLKKKELLLACGSALLALMVSLVLIEMIHWNRNENTWVAPLTRFDDELGWINVSNGTAVYEEINYTTNSLGFRSDEIDSSKEHILLVGDSVAFGQGVNNQETVSHFLENNSHEYQVLNLGVSGYGIDQYYLTLKKHIGLTNPRHIVVILYTVNDLTDTRSDHMSSAEKPLFIFENSKLVSYRDRVRKFSCSHLIDKSWTMKTFASTQKLVDRFCEIHKLPDGPAWNVITSLLGKINTLALQHDANLLFVLSPSLIGVKSSACDLQGSPDFCENLDNGFNHFYTRFRTIFENSTYRYLDFNDVLVALSQNRDIDSLYNKNGKDIHHYSARGNRILAKSIDDHLSKHET